MCPVATTRWCPTPEQLMILEEMYRGGVRTPNATQIQQITAHLSLYGKIEGKNVFYWFQNHKARDRQKLRRRLTKHLILQQQHQYHQFHQHHQQQQHQLLRGGAYHHHHQQLNQHMDHLQLHHPINGQVVLHHFIDPPPSTATAHVNISTPGGCGFLHQHPSRDNSAAFLPQVQAPVSVTTTSSSSCRAPQEQQTPTMNYTWRSKIREERERLDQKPLSRSSYGDNHDDDWMIISAGSDHDPDTTTTTTMGRPPLKTLELFPIPASGIKDDEEDDDDETAAQSRGRLGRQAQYQLGQMFPIISINSIKSTDVQSPAINID
ncbi:hypothetical protein Drorol1_Dr00004365 [Drosera rotundifolia]